MERFVVIVLAAALVALLVVYLVRGPTPSSGPRPSPAPAPTTAAPAPPGALREPGPPANADRMRVLRVYDGDTMTVVPTGGGEGRPVRLIGIDTPELRPAQCYAKQAAQALRRLARPGSTVTLAPDRTKKDRYGRWLRYVWNDRGVFVNGALAREGAAYALAVKPDVTYQDLFAVLVRQARAERRGLWGACPNPRPPVHGTRSS
ncbi:thermonuclease family protein [Streptosporangium sp. CA-135522]|uniref:thermonuclease family protein n=1 Tax=Streptosporangium sp. CA-135522 TaxID=3240072 RepID=UPI003D9360FC